jgi:hypothetical protein
VNEQHLDRRGFVSGSVLRGGPLTRARWPVRRASAGLLAALAAAVAAAVLVGLPHQPSATQRIADLHGVLQTLGTDTESCAGGLRDSLSALGAIDSGASHDGATATRIARDGAANCSPANNELLADLTQYQVPESLARYRLQTAVDDLVSWAFPSAQQVQADVVAVLSASSTSTSSGGSAARTRATQRLQDDLRQLDARRASTDRILSQAARSLGATESLPSLPG